jgi:hypothetical protein
VQVSWMMESRRDEEGASVAERDDVQRQWVAREGWWRIVKTSEEAQVDGKCLGREFHHTQGTQVSSTT